MRLNLSRLQIAIKDYIDHVKFTYCVSFDAVPVGINDYSNILNILVKNEYFVEEIRIF